MAAEMVTAAPLTGGGGGTQAESAVFHRDLGVSFPSLVKAEGIFLHLADGRKVLDSSGGPAVACLGFGNERIAKAIAKQVIEAPYCATSFYTTQVSEELARELVNGTNGAMARAYIINSGSEAMEAAVKLARQYFVELKQPQRKNFIARNRSYHGITLGALAIGGHTTRRAIFEPLLMTNVSKVSPCYAFRGKTSPDETDESYVARLAKELDDEFQRVGPETVCAFVAEPLVGAALGCVPSVPGYFQAVQAVCQKYGALLIMDEVMCGMGRTGTLHAWEQDGVSPDLQTVGKGLGAGYQAIAAVLASHRVVDVIKQGTSTFVHGHTYQGHPVSCAAALEVQRIVREQDLLKNVREMGELLSKRLGESIGSHPNVVDIRGRGLFWGIEFAEKDKTPFPPGRKVAAAICDLGLSEKYSIAVYPGAGTVDGVRGDHIIISPAYNISAEEVEMIISRLTALINDFFSSESVTPA